MARKSKAASGVVRGEGHDDPKSTGTRTPAATGEAASGRLTRSRARMAGPREPGSAGEASADPKGPEPAQKVRAAGRMGSNSPKGYELFVKKRRIRAAQRTGSNSPEEQEQVAKKRKIQGVDSAELMGGSKEGENTAAAAAGDDSSAFAARSLPPRWPPYPTSGKMKDRKKWDLECRRLANIPDPRHNLPTLRKPNDPYTADAVASTKYKRVVLQVALSVVTVSSTAPDGTEITEYTGIIVGWEEAKKCARILTCSETVCAKGRLLDPQPKLSVCLPDKTISEGRLLFFNDHYDIALLEISADSPLQLPSFGSNPNYGQEVFVLARDEESSLVARHGTILWSEESDYLGRNYYMFLSCEVPEGGTGGPAIDHEGNVTGMAFHVCPHSAILAISTILTCIDMWTMFGRIARPMLGMSFKTVALLDISLQEEIFLNYKINDGFIVHQVFVDSTAERLGFRRGDVIVSFDGQCVSTLPQLEDFLLSLGWGFLERTSTGSSYMVNFKLEAHDLLGCVRANITLPVGFSDASERVIVERMTTQTIQSEEPSTDMFQKSLLAGHSHPRWLDGSLYKCSQSLKGT